MQRPILAESEQQRAEAQSEQQGPDSVPQPEPQKREYQGQDAGIEYHLVVDAITPVARAQRLAEEVRHEQRQQVAWWPRKPASELIPKAGLPGGVDRQLGHREDLNCRHSHAGYYHGGEYAEGHQERPRASLLPPALPGAEERVRRQANHDVDKRGCMSRQEREANRQAGDNGQRPGPPCDSAPV